MNDYQDHSGTIIRKRRDFFGRYIITINAGLKRVSVIVGKAIYDSSVMGQGLVVGHCAKKLINIRPLELSENAVIWNRFIDEIALLDLAVLTPIRRNAAIAFRYDAEMNSGGHSGFFDCCPNDVSHADVETALLEVGADKFIPNFIEAYTTGLNDDYIKTDGVFFELKPSLTDIVMKYVLENREVCFHK